MSLRRPSDLSTLPAKEAKLDESRAPHARQHSGSAAEISIPFRQLRRPPALNVIGLPELIGLAGAALLAILVVFAYIYFYLPANAHLKSAELERKTLQVTRQSSGAALDEGKTTKERVDKINASLEDFESNWLPVQEFGAHVALHCPEQSDQE